MVENERVSAVVGALFVWRSNGKEVDYMAYVLTNGSYYVRMTKIGGVAKTKDINEARVYIEPPPKKS